MFYLTMAESEEMHFRVISLVVMALFLCAVILQSKNVLHMLQLSSYNVDQYRIWIKKNKKFFRINKILGIITIFFTILEVIGIIYSLKVEELGAILLSIIFLPFIYEIIVTIFSVIIIIRFIKKRIKKKELRYTDRIKRNIVCNVIIYVVLIVAVVFIIRDLLVMLEATIIALFVELAPLITYISFLIMLPVENGFKKNFMRKGSEKLKSNTNTRVVGITGSFGKTSVKNFLYQVLIKKYNTCKTPESYNTPMGVVITINEHLKSYDDIFICEMGARREGDIKEICDIVYPTDAIVTEVGAMHLDTLINIENVLKTKMELVDSVVARWQSEKCRSATFLDEQRSSSSRMLESIILLNGDNKYIRQYISDKNYDKEILDMIYFVGENSDNDFYVSDIKCSKDGSSFTLNISGKVSDYMDELCRESENNNESCPHFSFSTKLIGENNIKDIAFAIAYGMLKDVPIDEIISAVKGLEQVKNRLELINVNDNTILINDAYNSNPVGAKAAIDTVSLFDGYKKIIVTPGMVELGDKQYEKNNEMAKHASEHLDEVVVVGDTNKDALMDGAGDKALFIKEEKDAIVYAMSEQDKKIILLENDLTDNY